ncbi:uncharacterized protein P884DRAFT_264232 [Thermothelomyces heterothallicus CBS 202.75]|uniref:uncharacterized protein n=1 Tax=Thermothelomyces heterothallicus CBS 202.75 TaxID=1149848 RepID=UPI0037442C75
MASHNAFVLGATGVQGGAVARQLRALGWNVATIARDPDSAAAQALGAIGVQVHQGSWTDSVALEAAMVGSKSLFLNLVPVMENPASELEQGREILRIARLAGVEHVVYSSALFVPIDDPNHILETAFKAKTDLEKLVQTSGFPRWTVLRPGFFMSNYLAPKIHLLYPGTAETGLFQLAMEPTARLPMVDHEDIGKYAAAAFLEPDRFRGQVLPLISEVVPVERAMETMRRVTGRNIRAKYLSDQEVEAMLPSHPLMVLQQVAARLVEALDDGYDAPAEARKWGIETNTFGHFVERHKSDFDETFRNV